ncbi:MAG: transglutaminase domain-containing protein [Deltaproteobacteria bacterium]|nr:transglutaminase domain-containing protein [Deltaproteobacteria bacterium]
MTLLTGSNQRRRNALGHAGRARPSVWLLALVCGAGMVSAQPSPRVLHRPIPGDIPLDDSQARPPSVPSATPSTLASLPGVVSTPRGGPGPQGNGDIQRPRPTWEAPSREMDLNTASQAGLRLQYREVFTPSVQPFKRGSAFDLVDDLQRLSIRDPAIRPMVVGADAPTHWHGDRRARFVGSVRIEVSPTWPTPIPGVAGEQRVLRYATSDGETLEFLSDSAGNLFVRAAQGATVQLTYVLEAPESTFAATDLPTESVATVTSAMDPALRPPVPRWLATSAQTVFSRLSIDSRRPFRDVVAQLVQHFRSFRDAPLPQASGDALSQLALGGVGACRHRAYAMTLLLHALGIPARFVSNEAHAWVELWVPSSGWARVDLGGWNVPLDVDSTAAQRFEPARADEFARPPGYESQFSSRSTAAGDAGTWISADAAASVGANPPETRAAQPGPSPGSGHNAGMGASGSGGSTAASGHATDPISHTSPRTPAEALAALAGVGEREALVAQPTMTTLTDAVADEQAGVGTAGGFVRGSVIRVRGMVRSVRGETVEGVAVELELVRHGRLALRLGMCSTNQDGRFEGTVLLPATLETAEYSLRARSVANALHLSSVGE